jgi:hypothetical protein
MTGLFHKTSRSTRRSLGALACALSLTIFCRGSWAQEDEISIQVSVDRDTITIGDVVTYDLTINHSQEVLLETPQLSSNLGPFEVRHGQVLPQRKLEDGRLESHFRYVISIFTTGQQVIPPVEISYIDLAGQSKIIPSREVAIAVESLNPDEAGDIRDIKPPVSLPGIWAGLYWLVGSLILLAAGTILFLFLRKKRAQRSLEAIEYRGPPRPAHEIAMEELNRIASLKLLQRGLIKQFYTEMTEVMKRYIGRRYRLHTMELTTAELLVAMKGASVPGEHIGLFEPFFQEGDLVKFAQHIPAGERMNGALEGARQLILTTRQEPISQLAQTAALSNSEAALATSASGRE